MTKIISAIFCFTLFLGAPAEAHTQTVRQCHNVQEYVPTHYVDHNGRRHGGVVKVPAHYRTKRICNNVPVRHRSHTVVLRRTYHRHHHHHGISVGIRIRP